MRITKRDPLSLSLCPRLFSTNETTLLIYSVQSSRTKLKMTRSSIFCISFKRIPLYVFPYSPVEFQRASNGAIQPLRNSPPSHRLFVRYFRFDDEYQEIVEMRRDTNANETKGQMCTYYRMPCYEPWRASLPLTIFFNQKIKIENFQIAIKIR